MSKILGELDASIQAKLDGDADFQSSLDGLSEEERTTKISEKKGELLDIELLAIKENAEKAKKAEEVANNYKIRAEKAEKEAKKGETTPKNQEGQLNTKDTIALVNAKISTEDFDEVVNWANYRKISVSDALKDKTLQVILREKEEERVTANATATRGGGRSKKETPEEIVSRASTRIPESDDEIEAFAEARHQMKLKRLQK